MTQILERGEGSFRRRERLAKQKKGPGTFVYDGEAFDVEWSPTPKLSGARQPALRDDGMPIVDSSGRQAYKPAGAIVTDDRGVPVLGGVPKVTRTKIDVRIVRGIKFPAGKPVHVESPDLALKLRCLAHFTEVEAGSPAAEPEAKEKELADLTKAELLELAKNEGIDADPSMKKADLLALLDTKPAA